MIIPTPFLRVNDMRQGSRLEQLWYAGMLDLEEFPYIENDPKWPDTVKGEWRPIAKVKANG